MSHPAIDCNLRPKYQGPENRFGQLQDVCLIPRFHHVYSLCHVMASIGGGEKLDVESVRLVQQSRLFVSRSSNLDLWTFRMVVFSDQFLTKQRTATTFERTDEGIENIPC